MSNPNLDPPRMMLGIRRWSPRWSAGHRIVAPTWAQRRQWTRSALLVRLVQLLAGLAVLLLVPDPGRLLVLAMLVGLLVAVTRPAGTGQAVAVGAGIAGWLFGYDSHTTPPVARVLLFALALFVLHDSTSLAATVPMIADLRREAVLGWLRRSGLALLLAGTLAIVVYAAGGLVGFTTSYPLELAGLFGIVATLVVAAVLFSRSLR